MNKLLSNQNNLIIIFKLLFENVVLIGANFISAHVQYLVLNCQVSVTTDRHKCESEHLVSGDEMELLLSL